MAGSFSGRSSGESGSGGTLAGLLTGFLLAALLVSCPTTGEVQEINHQYGTYHLYVPETYSPDTSRVVVVVHGTPGEKDDVVNLAERFIKRWVNFAEETQSVIVAPAFDRENFASDSGAYGGYRNLYGRELGADEFLHGILEDIMIRAPVTEDRFFLYGHSAGGQFASRYLVRHPQRLLGVVLSAPGRYAFPDREAEWGYGMARSDRIIEWPDGEKQEVNVRPDPDGWDRATGIPVHVVIGDEDTNCQPCRPAHCDADAHCGFQADSTTRIQIGRKWVADMQALAESEGRAARTHMQLVSGVGHNSAALTDQCQEVFRNLMADRVMVPDVVGRYKLKAMEMLESLPLQGRIGEGSFSDRPKDEIVRQLPGAGSWVGKGSGVVITPSLEEDPPPSRTTVPNVVGQTLIEARAVINAAGYTPVTVFVDSNRPFDEVVGQEPDGGDHAAPGTEVRLFVSEGQGDLR